MLRDSTGKLGMQLTAEDTTNRRTAWNMTLDVNVTGPHVVIATFAPLLLKSARPRLIFITSAKRSEVHYKM